MQIIIDIRADKEFDLTEGLKVRTVFRCGYCKKYKEKEQMGINSKGKLFKVCYDCRVKANKIRRDREKDIPLKLNFEKD